MYKYHKFLTGILLFLTPR